MHLDNERVSKFGFSVQPYKTLPGQGRAPEAQEEKARLPNKAASRTARTHASQGERLLSWAQTQAP